MYIKTGLGFAVISGFSPRDRSRVGQVCSPDKEFRYLRHIVTSPSCAATKSASEEDQDISA